MTSAGGLVLPSGKMRRRVPAPPALNAIHCACLYLVYKPRRPLPWARDGAARFVYRSLAPSSSRRISKALVRPIQV